MCSSKVLELFFDDPDSFFHIREIARRVKLHPNTVLHDVHLRVKDGLLIKRRTRAVVEVSANRDAPQYYSLKRLYNLRQIYLSGVVDFLYKEYGAPEAMVLFGSYSRGEDTLRSDIDLAIITKRSLNLDVQPYEKLLKHTIQLHEIDLQKVGKNFITNLANGIVLKGYLNI